MLLTSSSFVHYAWCRRFRIERREAGRPFVVSQIMLTVVNRTHEFVILRAFAAHLPDYLNSRSPVYTMLHACYKN